MNMQSKTSLAVIATLFLSFWPPAVPQELAGGNLTLRADCENNMEELGLLMRVFVRDTKDNVWPALDPRPGYLQPSAAEFYPFMLEQLSRDPSMLTCPADVSAEDAPNPMNPANAQWYFDNSSYWYLGHAVGLPLHVSVFREGYKKAVGEGAPLKDDFVTGDEGAWETTVRRLKEGVERFYITDIYDPNAGAKTKATIPVLIERLGHHAGGGHVLYMDGRVEFMEYPGEFPMTEEFISGLREIEALRRGDAVVPQAFAGDEVDMADYLLGDNVDPEQRERLVSLIEKIDTEGLEPYANSGGASARGTRVLAEPGQRYLAYVHEPGKRATIRNAPPANYRSTVYNAATGEKVDEYVHSKHQSLPLTYQEERAPDAPALYLAERVEMLPDLESRIVFLNPEAAREALLDDPAYFAALTPADLEMRLEETVTPANFEEKRSEYRKSVGDSPQVWNGTQKDIVSTYLSYHIARLEAEFPGLEVPQIRMVYKGGGGETGLAYTRGNVMVLTSMVIHRLTFFINHELFHILSRYNLAHREALYGMLGFTRVDSLHLPDELKNRMLHNPDAMDIRWRCTVRTGEDQVEAVPLLYPKPGTFAMNSGWLAVEADGHGAYTAKLDEHGAPVVYSPSEVEGPYGNMDSRGPFLHPEEVLADFFGRMLYMLRPRWEEAEDTPNVAVLEQMKKVLREAGEY